MKSSVFIKKAELDSMLGLKETKFRELPFFVYWFIKLNKSVINKENIL